MILNFSFELASAVICIILWIASGKRYNVIDLKDKIYIHLLRVTTISMVLNMVAAMIIHKNVTSLAFVADIALSFSFFIMVWFWFWLNNYLEETVHSRNKIDITNSIQFGLPAFVNLMMLIANLVIKNLFDVNTVDGRLQVVFHSWCWISYLLVGISILTYIILLIKDSKILIQKSKWTFFIIPVVMGFFYLYQYQHKATAVLGFGFAIVLLLLYLYCYEYDEKIDGLTRLPNELSFRKIINYRIGSKQPMAVVLIALNDFKRVNQEYGYHNGNRFIKEIGRYLEDIAPKNSIARYAGDTFCAILDDISEESIKNWCNLVLARFEESWQVGKIEHKLSVCISVVRYPEMAQQTNEILDLLSYLNNQEKKNKKNQYVICDEEFKEKMIRRIRISSILKEVMTEGKMYVKYQPILDVEANAYTRGEALFRLKDGLLGDIPPSEFFPIAEENGYVIEIGYALIDQVCHYICSLKESGMEAPIISVNFSRQQFMADDVENRITQILNQYGLTPDAIAIELPEDVFSVQYEAVKNRMMQMADKGFRFYLDGFGTGFLDMSHLVELPFEIIKINKNMIREAENNDTIYLLVSAMTAVFEENGKMILGDGIESERLKEICDMLFMNYLQGYYFSEPVTEEKAKDLFSEKNIVETDLQMMEDVDAEWNLIATQTLEQLGWETMDVESDSDI